MPLFCDTVILFLIFAIILRDTRRGLLSSFTKSVGRILPLLLAFSLAGVIATLFERLCLYDLVYEYLSDLFLYEEAPSQALANEIPPWLSALSFLGGVGADLLTLPNEDKSEWIAALARPIAHGISSVIACFFLLIVFSIAIRSLITPLVSLVHKIPVIGFLDTVLGFLFGILHALLIAYLIALPLGALLGDRLAGAPILAFIAKISPLRWMATVLLR